MSEVITRLRLDHQRLAKVLDELEAVAMKGQHSTTVSDHLYCLLDYLNEYPHVIHHPTEDLIFAELLNKDLSDEQIQVVEGNASQHKVLEQRTAELMKCVDDADFRNDDMLQEYVTLQRQHMNYEESVVFQMALDVFSSADWQAVSAHLEKLHDPLFDAAEHRFAALFECLGVEPEKTRAQAADAIARFLNAT